jgi:hypothetical protein
MALLHCYISEARVTLIESEHMRKDTARQDCIGALRYVEEFCWLLPDGNPEVGLGCSLSED